MIELSIQKYFGRSFTPTQLIVATWSNVGYYDAQTDKVCVIYKCKNVFTKMQNDVGMAAPKTRVVYMTQERLWHTTIIPCITPH